MALWGAGGVSSPIAPTPGNGKTDTPPPYDPYFAGGKRRVSCSEGSDYDAGWIPIHKRPKLVDIAGLSFPSSSCVLTRSSTPVDVIPVPAAREIAFFVRPCRSSPAPPHPAYLDLDQADFDGSDFERPPAELESEPAFDYGLEHNYGLPHPPPRQQQPPTAAIIGGGGCSMERTASGLSISSGPAHASSPSAREKEDSDFLGDLEAAHLVREHLASFHRRSRSNSRHDRILRTLINPKNREAEFPIDEAALESIFSAANEIFFASRLSNRVTWDWSHESAQQYQSSVIGTTALRRCKALGGYETLIVLSRPILMSKNFSRRLLISTFLHELIHSYLFVTCGLKARESGGHTEGFHQIAMMIDQWAGPEHLRLREMEANLESYRAEPETVREKRHVYMRHGGEQISHEPLAPGSDSDGRVASRSSQYPDDNHLPVLRLQPHRLLRSRSQACLHYQQDSRQNYHRVHHHHHNHHHNHHRHQQQHQPHSHNHNHHPQYIHRENEGQQDRREDVWDEWIDDRWYGDGPAQANVH